MADLVSQLHDEIDDREEMRERVRAKIEEIRKDLPRLAAGLDDFADIFEAATAVLAAELDEETSRAVKTGFDHAKKRAEAS